MSIIDDIAAFRDQLALRERVAARIEASPQWCEFFADVFPTKTAEPVGGVPFGDLSAIPIMTREEPGFVIVGSDGSKMYETHDDPNADRGRGYVVLPPPE